MKDEYQGLCKSIEGVITHGNEELLGSQTPQ